ncbi:hypothetical protein FF2_005122 [Malus domestica]
MVTTNQLQILQSPITSLISSVSTSVTMKLDDTNYLTWHFQMQLLLEGHGIMGFVDGLTPCPSRFLTSNSGDTELFPEQQSDQSCACKESDEYMVWRIHDRALMQLITVTLSLPAISCVIGSTSAQDLWTRLKEQFSTVTRTSIFQMKSELQTIKKGTDSINMYLQRIKEARDYLSAAGVYFEDDDIVILTLNGLPSEYNTIRYVIRRREYVISLKDLRSQLLAEEVMIETLHPAPMLNALVAHSPNFTQRPSNVQSQAQSGRPYTSCNSNSGYKSFTNKNKGRFNSNNRFNHSKQAFNNGNPASGILGAAPQFGHPPVIPCQICGKTNHLADTCRFRNVSQGCQICGKNNHMVATCRFRDASQSHGCQICGNPNHSAEFCFQKGSSPMTAMYVNNASGNSISTPLPFAPHPQVWITDTGATNHMTTDLNNLSLATSYPSHETIHAANGEGQNHREDFVQRAVS